MSYLSLDPGDTAGWATFLQDGTWYQMGQVDTKSESMPAWLQMKINEMIEYPDPISLIICEDYKVSNYSRRKLMAHAGSRVPTIKQIGSIETVAELNNIPVHLQPNTNYKIGAMWGGFEIPKNHSISHQYVAIAHGIFYLQQNGLRKPSLISIMKEGK